MWPRFELGGPANRNTAGDGSATPLASSIVRRQAGYTSQHNFTPCTPHEYLFTHFTKKYSTVYGTCRRTAPRTTPTMRRSTLESVRSGTANGSQTSALS